MTVFTGSNYEEGSRLQESQITPISRGVDGQVRPLQELLLSMRGTQLQAHMSGEAGDLPVPASFTEVCSQEGMNSSPTRAFLPLEDVRDGALMALQTANREDFFCSTSQQRGEFRGG